MRTKIFLLIIMCLMSTKVFAHKNSDSYLNISSNNNDIKLRWDIALKDLNRFLKLDVDNNGKITWGEVKSRHNEIETFALSALQLSNNGAQCNFKQARHLINYHGGDTYAVIQANISCVQPVEKISVVYNFLFDQNPQHRGLLAVSMNGQVSSYVFSPDNKKIIIAENLGNNSSFTSFFIKGIEHLLGGVDHLLFLFVLLLPATMGVFRHKENSLKDALIETFKILTAFTIAHAITLTLSVLKLVSFPATPVEIIIAVSVAIAAIDNIRPVFGNYRWVIAGGFGLIHGFGFANALGPLNLSTEALFTALLAFNLGLEFAQVMVATFLIPMGFLLLHNRQNLAVVGSHIGSVLAITIAVLWTIDRSLDLQIMPF